MIYFLAGVGGLLVFAVVVILVWAIWAAFAKEEAYESEHDSWARDNAKRAAVIATNLPRR